jgi:hypothetical protein
MYNGYDAALVTSSGAAKNSIDKTKSKLAGRGVLLDVARHKGVRALEPSYAITVADLEATAAAERVEVLPGDLLLVPTRSHVALSRQERLAALRSRSVPRRLRAHRPLAARQADRGHRLRQLCGGGPPLGDRGPSQSLPRRGDPEHGARWARSSSWTRLAADCAADGRYAFLLVAPPLPVTRAAGTPINPYALK